MKNLRFSAEARAQGFVGAEASGRVDVKSKYGSAFASGSVQAGVGGSAGVQADLQLKKGIVTLGADADVFAGVRANAAVGGSTLGGLVEADAKGSTEAGASARGQAGAQMDLKSGTLHVGGK